MPILDASPPHPSGTLPLLHMHVRQLPATSKGLAYGRAIYIYKPRNVCYEGGNKIVKTHYICWRVWFQGRSPSIEVKIEMALVDSSRARTPPSKKFGSRPSFPLSCDPSRPSFWERRPTCPKTPRIYKRLKDGPLHSHVRT